MSLRPAVLVGWPILAVAAVLLVPEKGNAHKPDDPFHHAVRSQDGVVTIPLIPHHEQQQRRLKEGLLDESVLNGGIQENPSTEYTRSLYEEGQEEPRNLREADQVAELFQGYGTHYVDLWCGTPPQRQTVIVDTGSPVVAFPCSKCLNCGVPSHHIDTLFYEQCSSSFKKLTCDECLYGKCNSWFFHKDQCNIVLRYAEWSSWHAFEAQDSCYIGGLHTKGLDTDEAPAATAVDPRNAANFRVNLKFGCQTRISGLFQTQLADGILGMDQRKSSLWKQMYDAKTIPSPAFSLCYSRSNQASKKGTESGAMSLGGTNSQLHKTPMVYSSGNRWSGYHYVQVRKAYLREGKSGDSAATPSNVEVIEIGQGVVSSTSVIVDSGSTDSYFTKKLGPSFNDAFEKLTGKKYTTKLQKLTKEEVNSLPTIIFQLKGDNALNKAVIEENKQDGTVVGLAKDIDPDHPYDVLLAIPPTHYFAYDAHNDVYAARFFTNGGYMSVLGANAIMGHDVLFDGERHVIGFAESDCDYHAITEKVYPDSSELPEEIEYPTCIVNAIANTRKPICVSWTCQIFLWAVLFGGVIYLCRRLRKGRSAHANEEEYQKISASELEMQTPPSALSDTAPYRDDDDGLGGRDADDGLNLARSDSGDSDGGVLS